jgi:hypothetical protein
MNFQLKKRSEDIEVIIYINKNFSKKNNKIFSLLFKYFR